MKFVWIYLIGFWLVVFNSFTWQIGLILILLWFAFVKIDDKKKSPTGNSST